MSSRAVSMSSLDTMSTTALCSSTLMWPSQRDIRERFEAVERSMPSEENEQRETRIGWHTPLKLGITDTLVSGVRGFQDKEEYVDY